jgi:putative aldouronate transport system permease protein
MIGSSVKDRLIDIVLYTVIALAVLTCILPFLHVVSLSLSDNGAVLSRKVMLLPVGFNLQAYKMVLLDKAMIRSLWFTIWMTAAFTGIGMVLTVLAAYPLSKRTLKGRYWLMMVFIITLYFSGGIIPDYVLMHQLGFINKPWALILPLSLSPFNMIIMRTFFMNTIPESLEEAATLDGCSHLGILMRIVLPLSKPVLATLALFYAVGRWNAYSDALFYITKAPLYPLQLKLYNLVNTAGATVDAITQEAGGDQAVTPEVIRAACIIFATVPILLVYPFLQKYFVKGVMIGAVKG